MVEDPLAFSLADIGSSDSAAQSSEVGLGLGILLTDAQPFRSGNTLEGSDFPEVSVLHSTLSLAKPAPVLAVVEEAVPAAVSAVEARHTDH
jgi:hypothetical protein